MNDPTTIHGRQLGLFSTSIPPAEGRALEAVAAACREAHEAAEYKRIRQRDEARRVSKGNETSAAAKRSINPTKLEAVILAELAAGGPGTAEELGDRCRARAPEVSAWGPQTMSGACNGLLRKRRIFRADKRKGRSGRLAWIWHVRPRDSLAP